MKAEETAYKLLEDVALKGMTEIIQDIQDYARIQIEKDREAVADKIRTIAKEEGFPIVIVKLIDALRQLPIELD